MGREYQLSFRPTCPESIQKRLLCILSIGGLCLVANLWGAGVWQNSSPTTMNHSEMNHRPKMEAGSTSPPTRPPSSSSLPNSLEFESHHQVIINDTIDTIAKPQKFPPCSMKYSEYTPCQDNKRGRRFPRDTMVYRERHCPAKEELLLCLIPALPKYKKPLNWPLSRDYAWYDNIPHKKLTVMKAMQNWVQVDGDKFIFPGGGTMFPHGADAYIDDINKLIPLNTGEIRTALDTGCGVASWGAYMLKRNILAMSFAPRDSHEAQVQFALERGIPAMIGVLASQKLPYPARAFDMAHCSRCLIPWYKYDRLYLIEVDRVLRPGGYRVLSGPPIMWKEHWRGWERSKEDLEQEQDVIEEMARRLCWRKVIEKDNLAIWQKPINHIDCMRDQKMHNTIPICKEEYPDAAWYKIMKTCITPLPQVNNQNEVAGGGLEKWPRRAFTLPPRMRSGSIPGLTSMNFHKDNEAWKKIVAFYQEIIPLRQYRNIMDMNACLGGFAAALVEYPVWVMNVIPVDVKENTLGVIYERGFIGTYQDWCEAFSTYPRTYDLIHAAELISLYKNRCDIANILLEMDRILRPKGAVIFRDSVETLVKIQSIIERMRWKSQMKDNIEDGPSNSGKFLVAAKDYWTVEAIKED